MIKVLKYEILNLLKNITTWVFVGIVYTITLGLSILTGDPLKTSSALLTFFITLYPITIMIISIMDYYNSREFIKLLLTYPIRRTEVFLGKLVAHLLVFTSSVVLSLAILFIIQGWIYDYTLWLTISSGFITMFCISVSILFGVISDEKLKGLAMVITSWLLLALIYDSLIMFLSLSYRDYPIERLVMFLMFFNPLDLSRILVVMTMDIAALMGYTGAVFKEFLYGPLGWTLIFSAMLLWIILPILLSVKVFSNKDW